MQHQQQASYAMSLLLLVQKIESRNRRIGQRSSMRESRDLQSSNNSVCSSAFSNGSVLSSPTQNSRSPRSRSFISRLMRLSTCASPSLINLNTLMSWLWRSSLTWIYSTLMIGCMYEALSANISFSSLEPWQMLCRMTLRVQVVQTWAAMSPACARLQTSLCRFYLRRLWSWTVQDTKGPCYQTMFSIFSRVLYSQCTQSTSSHLGLSILRFLSPIHLADNPRHTQSNITLQPFKTFHDTIHITLTHFLTHLELPL